MMSGRGQLMKNALYSGDVDSICDLAPTSNDFESEEVDPVIVAMVITKDILHRKKDDWLNEAITCLMYANAHFLENEWGQEYVDLLVDLKAKAVFHALFSPESLGSDTQARHDLVHKYFDPSTFQHMVDIPEQSVYTDLDAYSAHMHKSAYVGIYNITSSKTQLEEFRSKHLSELAHLHDQLVQRLNTFVGALVAIRKESKGVTNMEGTDLSSSSSSLSSGSETEGSCVRRTLINMRPFSVAVSKIPCTTNVSSDDLFVPDRMPKQTENAARVQPMTSVRAKRKQSWSSDDTLTHNEVVNDQVYPNSPEFIEDELESEIPDDMSVSSSSSSSSGPFSNFHLSLPDTLINADGSQLLANQKDQKHNSRPDTPSPESTPAEQSPKFFFESQSQNHSHVQEPGPPKCIFTARKSTVNSRNNTKKQNRQSAKVKQLGGRQITNISKTADKQKGRCRPRNKTTKKQPGRNEVTSKGAPKSRQAKVGAKRKITDVSSDSDFVIDVGCEADIVSNVSTTIESEVRKITILDPDVDIDVVELDGSTTTHPSHLTNSGAGTGSLSNLLHDLPTIYQFGPNGKAVAGRSARKTTRRRENNGGARNAKKKSKSVDSSNELSNIPATRLTEVAQPPTPSYKLTAREHIRNEDGVHWRSSTPPCPPVSSSLKPNLWMKGKRWSLQSTASRLEDSEVDRVVVAGSSDQVAEDKIVAHKVSMELLGKFTPVKIDLSQTNPTEHHSLENSSMVRVPRAVKCLRTIPGFFPLEKQDKIVRLFTNTESPPTSGGGTPPKPSDVVPPNCSEAEPSPISSNVTKLNFNKNNNRANTTSDTARQVKASHALTPITTSPDKISTLANAFLPPSPEIPYVPNRTLQGTLRNGPISSHRLSFNEILAKASADYSSLCSKQAPTTDSAGVTLTRAPKPTNSLAMGSLGCLPGVSQSQDCCGPLHKYLDESSMSEVSETDTESIHLSPFLKSINKRSRFFPL